MLSLVYNATALSKARAAVEHAIAHLKTWRMLSEEGGRYRAPLEKYPSMLKAVIGLFFFAANEYGSGHQMIELHRKRITL